MNSEIERKYSFDVLKLVAISIIVLHHYQQIAQVEFSGGINWYGGFFYWGNLVELFFIISGYFAYRSVRLLQEKTPPVSFASFFLKKYLRFLPMLALCGLTCFVAEWLYKNIVTSSAIASYSFWNIISSLFGFERWFDTALMVNNPMWYVSVLLLCLVLFFIVTRLSYRARLSLPLAYGCMMVMGLIMRAVCLEYSVDLPFINVYLGRGIFCFFLGLIIAWILNRRVVTLKFVCSKSALLVPALVILIFLLLFVTRPQFVAGSSGSLYYALCFIVYPAFMVMCESSIMQRICRKPVFKNIGGIAYSMYAWHTTLILLDLIVLSIVGVSMENQVCMYVFLGICFLFAIASYRFIDMPLSVIASRTYSMKRKV